MEQQIIGENGKVVCAGVVCKCGEPGSFCPRHGKTTPVLERLGVATGPIGPAIGPRTPRENDGGSISDPPT